MSGVGFWEFMILALIGLLVLGPERLPRVANQLGGWLGQARRMTRVMRRQLEDELNFEKDLKMKKAVMPENTVSKPQYVHDKPVARDDHYSPEHDSESIGTGVNDAPDDVETDPESPDIAASIPSADNDVESAAAGKKTPA
ncbi:MAG: twin-arginine translocase subunit TatB [Proteobacteria bacterium]|nr:twin-arginine translocase subunit TatB [Pseudomonadota bacterium]